MDSQPSRKRKRNGEFSHDYHQHTNHQQAHTSGISRIGPFKKSFADLAGELRNEIYSYITPINGKMRDFQGLILSCKQVKFELEPIALETFTKYLKIAEESEKEHFSHIKIKMPCKLADMKDAQITFGVSALISYVRGHGSLYDRTRTNLFNTVDQLLGVNLSKLVIKLDLDGSGASRLNSLIALLNGNLPPTLFQHLGSTSICNGRVATEAIILDLDHHAWRYKPWSHAWYSHWSRTLQFLIKMRHYTSALRLWDITVSGVERVIQPGSQIFGNIPRMHRVEGPIDEITYHPKLIANLGNEFRVTKVVWTKKS